MTWIGRSEHGHVPSRCCGAPGSLASVVRVPVLASVVLASVAFSAAVARGAESKAEAGTAKQGVYEVKQDGYVEKIDPSIDYKERLPRIPPREPAESLEAFHLVPGFRLDLVASEPLIRDSIDLAFDANGRAYVVELTTYAEKNSARFQSNDARVSLLEDTDHDGRFDKSTVFVDGLLCPTGVACFDGGVFITCAPDVLYCKDEDGDAKADLREVVITGFGLHNPNSLPNSLRWGLDNRIHGMTSTTGGALRAVRWQRRAEGREAEPVQSRGRDFSFRPCTGQLRLESGGAQFGMSFDAWGRKFECSNSAPIYMIMYEDRYVARNPYLSAPSPRVAIWKSGSKVYRTSPVEPWRILRTELRVKGTFTGPIEGGGTPAGYFTGVCGTTIYTGSALPEDCRGDAFVCEGASNIVHHMRLEPDGVGFAAYRVEKEEEFLASEEIWFRPIQCAHAPDGALYLADMYREVYEHPGAVPPSAKKHLDLTSGKDRGRLYRIVPEGFEQPPPVRLGEASTAELVALLAHPNSWHRRTASRLLYERQDHRAIEPLIALAADSPSPLGRMHALYALDGLAALTAEVVVARLNDDHPRVREHAVRVAESVLAEAPTVREKLYTMTGDDDPRVRYQLGFTLGEIPSSRATAALAEIAKRDASDRWMRVAVLSSCLGRAGELFALLGADPAWRATKPGRAFLEELARQAGLENRSDQVAEVLQTLEGFPDDQRALAQAAVRGLSKGLADSGSPLLASLGSDGGSRAGDLLEQMVDDAKQAAADPGLALPKRVAAIRSLGLAAFDDVVDLLADLLDSTQPQEVQTAAIQALNRFAEDGVPEIIVDAWIGFTPKVRGEAAEALFARPERISVLLAAIEDGLILPNQLDTARIRFLTTHSDSTIRRQAAGLLESAQLAPREQIVKAWADVLEMLGDAERGRTVFRRECSKCHRLEDYGVELGLPLDTIQNRGPETILLSVLDPNRDVLPQYLNYVVVTDDGLSVTGMIESETATSITLKRAEGESDTVLRTNIDELVNTGMSIMPEGNEKLVTKQELADVIAYLMSLE